MSELDSDFKGSVAFQDLLRLVLGSEKTDLERKKQEKQKFYRLQLQWKKPDREKKAPVTGVDNIKVVDTPSLDDHSPIAVENLRLALACRGIRGIFSLEAHFERTAETSDFLTLPLREFRRVLHEEGLVQRVGAAGIEERDIRALFQKFQRKFDSGGIDCKKLMAAVRGKLGRRREAVVKAAFKCLDTRGVGLLDKLDLLREYDATQHPDVQSGRRSVNSVYREFTTIIEGLGADLEKGPEGAVNRQEWYDYHAALSMLYDNDDYFELLIMSTWHCPGAAHHEVGGGSQPLRSSAVDRLGRVREAKQRDVEHSRNGRSLGGTGEKAESEERARAVTVRRKLMERAASVGMDDFESWFDQFSGNNDRYNGGAAGTGGGGRKEPLVLSQKQMRRALSRLGARLEEEELGWLLNRLDADRSGRVDVTAFINFVQRGRGAEAYATNGGGYGDGDHAQVVGRGAPDAGQAAGEDYARGARQARDQLAATLDRIRRKLREKGGMQGLAKLEGKLRALATAAPRDHHGGYDNDDLNATGNAGGWNATVEAKERKLRVGVEHFVEIMRSFDFGVSAHVLGELYHSWCTPVSTVGKDARQMQGQMQGRQRLQPLSVTEVMGRVRGLDVLNQHKQQVVWEAFKYLDADARCSLPLEFLLDRFDPTQHPACEGGDGKSAAAIYREFLRTFPGTSGSGGRSGTKGRGSEHVMVSTNDWLRYHTDLGFCHPDDEAFAAIVYGCWQVSSRGGVVATSHNPGQRRRQHRGRSMDEGGDDNSTLQEMLRHKRGPARAPRVLVASAATQAREREEEAEALRQKQGLVVPPWGTGDSTRSPPSLRGSREGGRSGGRSGGGGGWTRSGNDGQSEEWEERHEGRMVRSLDGSYKSPGRGVRRQGTSAAKGVTGDATVLYSGDEQEVMLSMRSVLLESGLRGITALEQACNAHAHAHSPAHGGDARGWGSRGGQQQTVFLGGYGGSHASTVRCDASNGVAGEGELYSGLLLSTYEFRQALRQWAQQVQPSASPWLPDKDIAILAARFGSYVQSGGESESSPRRSGSRAVSGSGGGGVGVGSEIRRFDAAIDVQDRFRASSRSVRPVRKHYRDEVFAGAFLRELLGLGVNGPADRPWRRVMIDLVFDELIKRYRGRRKGAGGKLLASGPASGAAKGGVEDWGAEADKREEEARNWPLGSVRQAEAGRWAKKARARAKQQQKEEEEQWSERREVDDGESEGEGCPLEWLLDVYDASKHPGVRRGNPSSHPYNPNSLYRDLVAAFGGSVHGTAGARSGEATDLNSHARVGRSDWMALQLKFSCLMPDDEDFRAALCLPWGCNSKIVDKQASALAGPARNGRKGKR
jgi:Ca2+-binding EF-hand superfamily protein